MLEDVELEEVEEEEEEELEVVEVNSRVAHSVSVPVLQVSCFRRSEFLKLSKRTIFV